ncbi:hypothetical protein CEXT_519181 [Caerostris extrusa]|uniref:Uncharacterized protein n=1 Tax=Caerostris extrusa TaxID=172846 RepID=A0AAV4RH06_CAEEX|nr:hypothetical protein CEXT_519181 [Caerostris extrusa]
MPQESKEKFLKELHQKLRNRNSEAPLLEEKFPGLFISNGRIPIFVIVAFNLEANETTLRFHQSRFITDAGFSLLSSAYLHVAIFICQEFSSLISGKFAKWYCLLDAIPKKRSWNFWKTHFWRRFIIWMMPVLRPH